MSGSPARKDITIPFGNASMAAWLYAAPSGSRKPGPAIVLGHGLGGVKEMRLDAFAEVFQKAGYTCVAFDYRGFGQSTGSEPQILDWNMQQQDWDVVVEWVRSLPEVDPDQIGIFGTSFGGAHAIAYAARDKRIKAAISQCPFTSGPHSTMTVGLSVAPKLALLGIRDILFGKPNDFVPVKLCGEPGEVALMNAPDVMPSLKKLVPDDMWDSYPRVVAARVALQIPFLFPGAQAKNVSCPIYFAVCSRDSVAPPGPTRSYAKQAPKGVVKDYDCGHFDIYVGSLFEQASKDYVEFLHKNLPVSL
ncbi:hypothetical protein OIO90_004941 [Microbotryomycetes sp. JL221]|nr:hypothetical protein OIO90_004941 [Microbotryomycetes sp. JL221]